MLINYFYFLFLIVANSFEMLMAVGSRLLENEEKPVPMVNGSLEEKSKENYFINRQEKVLFLQLASSFLFKYTYEELRITESDDIIEELTKTFFPSLAASPNFNEIFGKKNLSSNYIADLVNSLLQNPKKSLEVLEKSIVKFVKRIINIEIERKYILSKKEFDVKLQENKFKKIIKLFKLTENEVEETEKLFIDLWKKVNKNYKYLETYKKMALFYNLSFWQIAMDYSDHQQEKTSPIREWILDTLIPLMDKKLRPSVTGNNEDALTYNLRILFRALPEEKSIKRQLDFAFRIAPKNREECNEYCVNAISILKKEIENIRTTGAFYKIIDDLSNQPDKNDTLFKMKYNLPGCMKKAEKKSSAEMGDNSNNFVQKLFITFYDCMIISTIKSYYGGNYKVELNWSISFLKYLLWNMLGELVENKPAIHLELAKMQIQDSMLTEDLSLEVSHSFQFWPFMENRKELESELYRGIFQIAQEKSQTITLEELIGKIEEGNYKLDKYMFASKNELAEMLERARIKTKEATKKALVLTKGIETICFLKNYYEEIIHAYKQKNVIRELLPAKVANLDWLEKGLVPELKTMLSQHGLGEDNGQN